MTLWDVGWTYDKSRRARRGICLSNPGLRLSNDILKLSSKRENLSPSTNFQIGELMLESRRISVVLNLTAVTNKCCPISANIIH